jgi:hypothetical protein
MIDFQPIKPLDRKQKSHARAVWGIVALAALVALVLLIKAAFAADVEWSRLRGTVKAVNLKAQTVTIQNSEKDLLTVPIDYQVKIVAKGDALRALKDLELDERITLYRTLADQPKEDTEGLVPPEWEQPKPKGRN